MRSFVFDNVDDAAKTLAVEFQRYSKETSLTRELTNVVYELRRPLERIISFPSMTQYKTWAYGEVMTEMLGLNPPMMENYISSEGLRNFMQSFHRYDGRANYTYGERWHVNQAFQGVLYRLQTQPGTRQALMNIWDSSLDLRKDEANVPCTIIHQFLLRPSEDEKRLVLSLIVYMRSNDFFRGFKYDTFLNSMILEAFASWLGDLVDVGTLTFHVGSLHIYKEDTNKLLRLLSQREFNTPSIYTTEPLLKPIMLKGVDFTEYYKNLWLVHEIAQAARHKQTEEREIKHMIGELHSYFRDWAWAFVNWTNNAGCNTFTGRQQWTL